MPLGLGLCGTCCTTCTCTLDTIANQVGLCGNTLPSVSLTGISATGHANPIVITATSSNTSILANPTVNYTSPNTTGSLTLNWAGGNGSVVISVTVTSTGCTPITKTASFGINNGCGPPTIAQVSPQSIAQNSGTTHVPLTGIGFGPNAGCGATVIQLGISTVPAGFFAAPSVTYTSPNTTGTANLQLIANSGPGTVTVTIQVLINGLAQTGGPCNFANKNMNFTVTIT